MFEAENQHIEFVGDNVIVVKNKKLTSYLAMKIENITSIQLDKQDREEIRISTLLIIWLGFLSSLFYGLGLPILIFGLYKHYKLDREYSLKLQEKGNNEEIRINLPRMKNEDLEYILYRIANIMSGIEQPAKALH